MHGTAGTAWQGSSAESLTATLEALDAALDAGADGAQVGESLFVAADVLREQPALRRAATDPTVPGEAQASLVRELFGPHLVAAATDVVAAAAARRWGASGDLADALAYAAVVAVVRAADAAGAGDRLEEELFRFSRVVAEHPELRDALSDTTRSQTDKQGLVRDLIAGKVSPQTLELCERAVTSIHRTVTTPLEDFIEITSQTRGRLVARVRAARELPREDVQRLTDALSGMYARPVHVNLVIDPDVIGGLHVAIGDEVIDGTVANRLDEARRQLAG